MSATEDLYTCLRPCRGPLGLPLSHPAKIDWPTKTEVCVSERVHRCECIWLCLNLFRVNCRTARGLGRQEMDGC